MALEGLLDDGLVAIVRAATPQHVLPVAETLFEARISVVEVALTTPLALEEIVRRHAGNCDSGGGHRAERI